MRWLNIRHIMFTLLTFLFISSSVAGYYKNANAQESGCSLIDHQQTAVPQVTTNMQSQIAILKSEVNPYYEGSNISGQDFLDIEEEVRSQEIARNGIINQLNEITKALCTKFSAYRELFAQINDVEQCCAEPHCTIFAKLNKLRDLQIESWRRIISCVTEIVNEPTYSTKPDYKHIFLNDLQSDAGQKLYQEVLMGPFVNQQHRSIVTLLIESMELIEQMPGVCEAKWEKERELEGLVNHTSGYAPTMENPDGLSWMKYTYDDNGYYRVIQESGQKEVIRFVLIGKGETGGKKVKAE